MASKTWDKILKWKRHILVCEQCMSITLKKRNVYNRVRIVLQHASKQLYKRQNLMKSGKRQSLDAFSLQSRAHCLTGVVLAYIRQYDK
jgi:hypothetical protein